MNTSATLVGENMGSSWQAEGNNLKGLQSTTNVFKLSDKKVPVTRGVELKVPLFVLLHAPPPPFRFTRICSSSLTDVFCATADKKG